MTDLRTLIGTRVLDAELAALAWLLAERGVPIVIAARERAGALELRAALSSLVLSGRGEARDALAGGVVIGGSLEDVLRHLGADGLSDETRDIGLVLVLADGRVAAAHYVRPVERDAAGHLQRRPPAVLSAWNAAADRLDHFWWAVTDELATRADMTRHVLEDEHERRVAALAGPVSRA